MGRKKDPAALSPGEALREALREAGALLSARPYSKKELSGKLMVRGFSEETTDAVLDRLSEAGLLDDQAYAGLIVRHYADRGYGPLRVERELARRGIGRDEAKEAVRAFQPEEERIIRLLRQKLKGDFSRAARRRAVGALMRRGYRLDQIESALTHVTGQASGEEEFSL